MWCVTYVFLQENLEENDKQEVVIDTKNASVNLVSGSEDEHLLKMKIKQ